MQKILKNFQREFPITEQVTYLDHAAMSPLPESVKEALAEFHEYRLNYGADFSRWWEKVDDVRKMIAGGINSQDDEIVFTSNTSMGINLAAASIPFEKGDNVVITDLEFPSNVYPWMNLSGKNIDVKFVKHRDEGFRIEQFEELIDNKTKAVSISWIMSGTGEQSDIEGIGKLCKRKGIYFIIDAIQGLGVLPLDVKKVHADFVVSGFFKWMFGPDGIAFVYINRDILDRLYTPYAGWAGMKERFSYNKYNFLLADGARRFETGNMNFSAIYGVGEALNMVSGVEQEITDRVIGLTRYLRRELASIPGVEICSPLCNEKISGITLFKTSSDIDLFSRLKKENIVVNYRNGIRVSPHFYNTKSQIELLLNTI